MNKLCKTTSTLFSEDWKAHSHPVFVFVSIQMHLLIKEFIILLSHQLNEKNCGSNQPSVGIVFVCRWCKSNQRSGAGGGDTVVGVRMDDGGVSVPAPAAAAAIFFTRVLAPACNRCCYVRWRMSRAQRQVLRRSRDGTVPCVPAEDWRRRRRLLVAMWKSETARARWRTPSGGGAP